MLTQGIINLVESFENQHGLPFEVFEATEEIVRSVFGEKPAKIFVENVEEIDNKYSFKEGVKGQYVIDRMFEFI